MNKRTFAGIDKQYANEENAKIAIIPVSYDGTSTWVKGADKGPDAFLAAAENMELYDIETDSEVYKEGIALSDFLNSFTTVEKMVDTVYRSVTYYLEKQKFTTLIGGEHSISIGAIRAFSEYFEDLTVLQLDAHADLRPSYEGSVYNHACALHEAGNTTNLIQVGIRSMDMCEKQFTNPDKIFYASDLFDSDEWIEKAISKMTDNIYMTIDLDVFDPSVLPSTGTPEPGGMNWYQVLSFIKKIVESKKIVGFDIVELCPNEFDKSSDFLAAKLYYKILSYIFSHKTK